MLLLLLPLSQFYRYPSQGAPPRGAPAVTPDVRREDEFTPREMLRTRQWYVMYIGFTITISIVLIFGAQMKMLAREYALPSSYFHLLLVVFPLANGCSRLAAGWASDRLGRVAAMQRFFALLGLSILGLVGLGHVPELFCLFVVLAALFGGAPFVLYPAAIGDFYGSRYSTANYGITYTAKAWSGVISGWLSGYIMMRFGSLRLLLIAVGISSLGAAVMCHPRLLRAPEPAPRGSRRAPEATAQ
jgi:OFA family oxalate/formate antiporter-like MFS transporter